MRAEISSETEGGGDGMEGAVIIRAGRLTDCLICPTALPYPRPRFAVLSVGYWGPFVSLLSAIETKPVSSVRSCTVRLRDLHNAHNGINPPSAKRSGRSQGHPELIYLQIHRGGAI